MPDTNGNRFFIVHIITDLNTDNRLGKHGIDQETISGGCLVK